VLPFTVTENATVVSPVRDSGSVADDNDGRKKDIDIGIDENPEENSDETEDEGREVTFSESPVELEDDVCVGVVVLPVVVVV